MREQTVFSLCGMCSVRCPVKVQVAEGKVRWVQGNDRAGLDGALCPRGAAGISLLNDEERLREPLIRIGDRGSGKWKRASWEEALSYIAEKLEGIRSRYGSRSIAFGNGEGPMEHVSKTFLRALGSPNHFSNDGPCNGSLHAATRSLFGFGADRIGYDYRNCEHIVLFGRNILESIELKETLQLVEALDGGATLTYIDPRVTLTASKAHQYFQIRPGTDLALNYGLMHTLLSESLYDQSFVERWVQGLDPLQKFLEPYDADWAGAETGIEPERIRELARALGRKKPAVILHAGHRCSNYKNEFYFRRSILMLNCLLGAVETPGGLYFRKGLQDVGATPPRTLLDQDFPEFEETRRFDECGSGLWPLADPDFGVPQLLPRAILKGDPYPIKALFLWAFDPICALPDAGLVEKALRNLELLVSLDVNFSESGWIADVVLPESTYLERTDCVMERKGLIPQLSLRQQAVTPLYNTRPGQEIIRDLAHHMGLGPYFPYETAEDLNNYMLEPTGVTAGAFRDSGGLDFSETPVWWDRENGLRLATKTGKMEFASPHLKNLKIPLFPAYEPVQVPPAGMFRLIVGRCPVHTHASTQNNPMLSEMYPENVLWIHPESARKAEVRDGEYVEVSSSRGTERIRLFITELIHPHAVFMVHGFGHRVPVQTRSFGKGARDSALQENISDPVGGSPAYHETFVAIAPCEGTLRLQYEEREHE